MKQMQRCRIKVKTQTVSLSENFSPKSFTHEKDAAELKLRKFSDLKLPSHKRLSTSSPLPVKPKYHPPCQLRVGNYYKPFPLTLTEK